MFNNSYKMPEKPETQKHQIDVIWDTIHNCVMSTLKMHDWKINFLILLVMALLGILLAK